MEIYCLNGLIVDERDSKAPVVIILHDVVLEIINSVREGALTAEEERVRVANTDLFLNAMGVSSSQILSVQQT
ncbi:hypothetical protein WOLCODRAFT_151894 [Wolfiporia cocos MD-104 SS10]|uniref:Uncharacterized protein n=1 Tax=Wolfiporia cocos (strain MD-104) TaxID=742152 RepID=A0A2H3K0A4_WOLCO|nr:hypothetical protein WOLCODRAFT_151894 [Wolfiporia cocos MD-104 SS10]